MLQISKQMSFRFPQKISKSVQNIFDTDGINRLCSKKYIFLSQIRLFFAVSQNLNDFGFKGNENFQAHTIKFLLYGHWRKDKNINFTVTFKMLEILTSAENPIPWLMFTKINITGREESWQTVSHLSLSTDWRLVFNCWCISQWFLLFFLSKFPLFKISLLLA